VRQGVQRGLSRNAGCEGVPSSTQGFWKGEAAREGVLSIVLYTYI